MVHKIPPDVEKIDNLIMMQYSSYSLVENVEIETVGTEPPLGRC